MRRTAKLKPPLRPPGGTRFDPIRYEDSANKEGLRTVLSRDGRLHGPHCLSGVPKQTLDDYKNYAIREKVIIRNISKTTRRDIHFSSSQNLANDWGIPHGILSFFRNGLSCSRLSTKSAMEK